MERGPEGEQSGRKLRYLLHPTINSPRSLLGVMVHMVQPPREKNHGEEDWEEGEVSSELKLRSPCDTQVPHVAQPRDTMSTAFSAYSSPEAQKSNMTM